MKCDQCQIVAINGTPTHEIGCPMSHRNPMDITRFSRRECLWCGTDFEPEDNEDFCNHSCWESYTC